MSGEGDGDILEWLTAIIHLIYLDVFSGVQFWHLWAELKQASQLFRKRCPHTSSYVMYLTQPKHVSPYSHVPLLCNTVCIGIKYILSCTILSFAVCKCVSTRSENTILLNVFM